MRPQRSREAGTRLNLGHSFTKDETPHLIPKLFYLFRIGGGAKAFGKSEECLLFLPPRFQALFEQFNQNPVVAEAFFSGDALSTCSASRVGSVTLLRTCFLTSISPSYTIMVHSWVDAADAAPPLGIFAYLPPVHVPTLRHSVSFGPPR
jgi:hypothetical protein